MAPEKQDLPRRIALAHEWFTPRSTGGAELVVQAIDALLQQRIDGLDHQFRTSGGAGGEPLMRKSDAPRQVLLLRRHRPYQPLTLQSLSGDCHWIGTTGS